MFPDMYNNYYFVNYNYEGPKYKYNMFCIKKNTYLYFKLKYNELH